MAEKKQASKKPQLTLEEYNKIKDKQAKSKLKLHFPTPVKIFLLFPAAYLAFLIIYYLVYIRFAVRH